MPWSLLIPFISVGMPPTTLTQQLHIAKQIIELFVLGTSVTCKAFFPSQYLSWVFRLIKLCWLTSLSQRKGTIRILNFQETQYISSKIPHYKLWWHKWILYVQDIVHFTCNVFLFLLFEILQLPRGVCGWYSYPWDLGKTAWGGPSKRGVSTIQEELSVIDDAGAYFVLGGGGG